jgi:organic radical activating enzyme
MIEVKEIYPAANIKYVTWVLNNVCPYSCIYCPEIVHNGKIKSYFDWEIHEEFLDYLFNHWRDSTIIFAVTGGEPTVHPFFEKILDKINNNGHITGLTTNLSRNFNFWERVGNKLEYASTSFHPHYINTGKKEDEFIDKLNLLGKTGSCEVRVMMYPDLFNRCVEFIKKLERNFIGDDVIPVIILEDFGVNEKYCEVKYTKRQLNWINAFDHNPVSVRKDGLRVIKEGMKHQGYFVSEDNKRYLVKNLQQVSNERITNFYGWECNIGIDSIYIDFDGSIKGGNCLEGGYIGDLLSKVNWNIEPIICGSTYCHCVTDIKIKKKATKDSDMISVPDRLFTDYVGEYKDGKTDGQGVLLYPGGEKYEGKLKDGLRNGYGTFTLPNGEMYVGEWKNDVQNGQGIYTNPDGGRYVGEFKDGYLNGQGTYTNPDGQKYVGEYKDGYPNGWGTTIFPGGQKYVGENKHGKRTGQGTFTNPDGERYVGEWKDDLQNGYGIHTYPDGRKYEGEFKNGKYNGRGTWIHPDYPEENGIFKDGKIVK